MGSSEPGRSVPTLDSGVLYGSLVFYGWLASSMSSRKVVSICSGREMCRCTDQNTHCKGGTKVEGYYNLEEVKCSPRCVNLIG